MGDVLSKGEKCPECGGEAYIEDDEDHGPILLCLERECLHWEVV